ncbi:hypothetical protein [Duganella sp. HH105]|uniref:hypothetical protein n=1 Tax=Duganella sp. HH105 TaxID=1781067 RepID=UPI000877C7F9|nr:hypothetical protein [Duganella sp. HH105]OEZ52853.1 hypothetical protein DUGA6_60890 [Duganella sp. HH105]
MTAAIGSVAQLVKVIQTQLSSRAVSAGAGKRQPAAEPAAADRYAQENLASLIELRVRQIARDDPNRGRKAFRVFLEAVLLSQFGEGLVNDPRFFQMVDDIHLAMEADADCRALVAKAIEQLLAEI